MSKRRKFLKRHPKQKRLEIEVEKRRVVIATPCGDLCHTLYLQSLVHMVAHTMNEARDSLELSFLNYGTSILPMSRQFLAVRALELDATHMLWIDSDMEFPVDLLMRMMRHDQPLVAANCMARRAPYMITARDESGHEIHTTQESSGLEKVDRFGFGVVWMSTDVLRKIELPYFDLTYLPEKGVFTGEDFVFCEKAKAAGYELYIDHDVSKEIKHVGTFGYSPLFKGPGASE